MPSLDASSNAIVAAVLADQWRRQLDTVIDLRDEMLRPPESEGWDAVLADYFLRGLGSFRAFDAVCRAFVGKAAPRTLEFACGFGRVTRFLVEAVERGQLFVSDLQDDALQFQADHFGVQTLRSSYSPDAFQPDRSFDVIHCNSLFSHLPDRTFRAWLSRLTALLAPDGILLFTVHDESLIPADRRDAGGITFRAVSESDRLIKSEYGSTWVSAAYVFRVVQEECGRPVMRWARGVDNYQDAYIVGRSSTAGSVLDQGPDGDLGICRTVDDAVELIGWAIHRQEGRSVAGIELRSNGDVLAATSAFFRRRDVAMHTGHVEHENSGWRLEFQPGPTFSMSTAVVILVAISDLGAETVLYAGTVTQALLKCAVSELSARGLSDAIRVSRATAREQMAAYLAADSERPAS